MVDKFFQPTLLTDKSRLQEIYDLRVFAWENSEQKKFVNKYYFRNGWKDNLDNDAYHYIVEVEDKIIASSRVCILENINLIEEDFSNFDLPTDRPFAFYSRLVVHPKFRGLGLTQLMDRTRIEFIRSQKVAFTLAWASSVKRQFVLQKIGFKMVGYLTHKYGDNPTIDSSPAYILLTSDIQPES